MRNYGQAPALELCNDRLSVMLGYMKDTKPHENGYNMRCLEAADLERSFAMATRVFVAGSTLHRALDIGLEEYREYLWPSFRAMASEGLSVVSVDPKSDEILGCMIITDFTSEVGPGPGVADKFAPISALTSQLMAKYSYGRNVGQGGAMLIDMGAVAPEASGRGIYKAMRHYVHQMARKRGFRYVLAELSSAATQHVVIDQIGHRKMAEVKFAEFEFRGSRPFSAITDPESIVLSQGDLT